MTSKTTRATKLMESEPGVAIMLALSERALPERIFDYMLEKMAKFYPNSEITKQVVLKSGTVTVGLVDFPRVDDEGNFIIQRGLSLSKIKVYSVNKAGRALLERMLPHLEDIEEIREIAGEALANAEGEGRSHLYQRLDAQTSRYPLFSVKVLAGLETYPDVPLQRILQLSWVVNRGSDSQNTDAKISESRDLFENGLIEVGPANGFRLSRSGALFLKQAREYHWGNYVQAVVIGSETTARVELAPKIRGSSA